MLVCRRTRARFSVGHPGRRSLAPDRNAEEPHHPLPPPTALTATVQMGQQAEIGQRQQREEQCVGSTHAFDTTRG